MPLTSNQQLFEYHIMRILGQGAFGIVYLAHDMLLDRPVAIKELTVTAQTDEVAFKRFIQEARAAGNLNHLHIVTVYALKVMEPEVYLVMEYLPRGSLRTLLEERGLLPVEEAVRIAADVCEGLAAAHAKGIVHRDVKPENVLLAEDGRAKIGDFGIARVPQAMGGYTMTSTGFQPGTLPYMSPEQVRGQQVDERSDVYSVGVVLYEVLTGRHYVDVEALGRRAREMAGSNVMLFQARLYELLAEAVCDREPEGVCRVRLDVPEWVGEVVAATLAKRVEERPTAGELARRLRLGQGYANATGQSASVAVPMPLPIHEAPSPQPGADVSLLYTLRGHTDLVWTVTFSPDGHTLASESRDRTVCLWDVATGREVKRLKGHEGPVRSVAFSPDGRFLTSGSGKDPSFHEIWDYTVRVWDITSGREVQRLEGHTDGVTSVAFSPNGRVLASGSSDKTVRLWQVKEARGESFYKAE